MSEFTQRSEKQGTFLSGSRAAAEDAGAQSAEMVDNRVQAQQLAQMRAIIEGRPGVAQRFAAGGVAQLAGEEEEMQMKAAPAQLAGPEEEMQMKAAPAQLAGPEEEMQMKAAPAQLAGPEEEMQMKAAPVQLAGPEEEMQMKAAPAQLAGPEEEMQMKAAPAQLAEEEEPLQGKFAPVQRKEGDPARPNTTGMPDHVKSNIESMGGVSLDDAKVHYGSSKPAQLNALAFAQGKDIHIAAGQEKHLGHEAWHLVQQAQGRVEPTKQLKMGVPVNDDPGLEHEADVMGAAAMKESDR